MKNRTSIQFRAAFLTMVFLLNTIVGFACAVGLERGLNEKHTHTTHDHHHAHDNATEGHDHSSSKNSKENCCKDEVAKLTKADKIDVRAFDYSLLSSPLFILPTAVYQTGEFTSFPVNTPNGYFEQHCRSPIQDIRITIQSFQI